MNPEAEAWWRAVHTRDPRISFAYFLGMGALPPSTPFCVLACGCRARQSTRVGIARAMESLGYRGESPDWIRRIPGPRGLRSHRELASLADWMAILLRPAARGGCLSLDPPAWHATGLAAYDLLARDLSERTALQGVLSVTPMGPRRGAGARGAARVRRAHPPRRRGAGVFSLGFLWGGGTTRVPSLDSARDDSFPSVHRRDPTEGDHV